jgi:DNA helicase II / ATP-dependent DNA helicase PcrA
MSSPTLTKEQELVVGLPPGPWLVTAPPGCGKTEVLVRRVEHLLAASGRSRSKVLVLTFTRRAAENVVERVQRTLPKHVERVVAQRFHQFCHEVLRQQAPDRVRNLYEGRAERLLALRRALDEEGLEFSAMTDEDLLQQVELAKKTLAFEKPEFTQWELRPAFDAYVGYQQRERICDYDDLILDVIELFRGGSWPLSAYRQLYGSVLVDEAQDLNASQYALVEMLAGAAPHDVTLLADQRQSIFAFNGADLSLLERFVTDFQAGRHSLTLSFRCGRRIVAAANAVAAHLKRAPEALSTEAVLAPGVVEIQEAFDDAAEATWTAERIQGLLASGLPPNACHPGERLTLEPSDIAVLGRSRKSLAAVEQELRARVGRVVTSYGRDESLASSLGRTALWVLRAVAHPSDVIIRQQMLASAYGAEPTSTTENLEVALSLLASSERGEIAAMASAARNPSADTLLVSDILSFLESHVPEEDAEEADALASDVDWMKRIRAQLRRNLQREPRVSEFTQSLTMTSAAPVEGPGVRVLTVHAAKGHEFRVVALVGLREGMFPSFFAKTPKELEEERRLAYVAITRASRLLLLTRPKTWITSYGNRRVSNPSPFIQEVAATLARA